MALRPGYNVQHDNTGAPYLDVSSTARPVQWCLYERHANSLTVTAREIVDDARVRHWAFSELALVDGALVRWLNQRQRYLLLMFRGGLKGLVTRTVRTLRNPDSVPGTRVGVTPRGVPYDLTEAGDGYAVYFSGGNPIPYIDTAGVPIANDPTNDGWPLPFECVSVTGMKGVMTDDTIIPITTETEDARTVRMPGRRLVGFVTGNRVAPVVHPNLGWLQETWNGLASTELSYIAIARVRSLCCELLFPTVLVEALVAGMAEFLGTQAKQCPAPDKAALSAAARLAESTCADASSDVLGEVRPNHVVFKRR